jgi:pilus assembly protein CpaC
LLRVRSAEMQRTVAKSLSSSLSVGGIGLGGDLGIEAGTGSLTVAP